MIRWIGFDSNLDLFDINGEDGGKYDKDRNYHIAWKPFWTGLDCLGEKRVK